MEWNHEGLLIVGDQTGLLTVWGVVGVQVHAMGQITESAPIFQLVFRPGRPVEEDGEGKAAVDKDRWYAICEDGQIITFLSPPPRPQMLPGAPVFSRTVLPPRTAPPPDLAPRRVGNLPGQPAALLYLAEKDLLAALSRTMTLQVFRVFEAGDIRQTMKVKLSSTVSDGGSGPLLARAVGSSMLATLSADNMIRIWDLEHDENYVLSLIASNVDSVSSTDRLCCMDFDLRTHSLLCCTQEGKVVVWRFYPDENASSSEACWEVHTKAEIPGPLVSAHFGPGPAMFSLQAVDGTVSSVRQVSPLRTMTRGVSAIQTGLETLVVEQDGKPSSLVRTSLRMTGIALSPTRLVLWSGPSVEVYNITQAGVPRLETNFEAKSSSCVAIAGESLYLCHDYNLQICNLQGAARQTLPFAESEGAPALLDTMEGWLAVASQQGTLKIANTAQRSVRLAHTFHCEETPLTSIRVNCKGARVSYLAEAETPDGGLIPDTRIHIYDADRGASSSFDFADMGLYPTEHFWDPQEARLLVVALRHMTLDGDGSWHESRDRHIEIAVLFPSPDGEIFLADQFTMSDRFSALLGVRLPFLHFVLKDSRDLPSGSPSSLKRTDTMVLRDFVGMENADASLRAAMIDFTYHLTLGNMDEAYKAVKLIRNPSVWENMARMCVKTRRLDVALVCFSNLGHARGAMAIREAKKEPEPEAQLGTVAIQLGMTMEAERLYKECKRYDLLNKLYQASGRWQDAIALAQEHDTVHLQATHHLLGCHLESTGDVVNAIKSFEAAGTQMREIPRMLYPDHLSQLHEYVDATGTQPLYQWWAQYCESIGHTGDALAYYRKARDFLSIVRIHCYQDQFDRAEQVITETADPLAACHLARQFESRDNIQAAIKYFTHARRYNHAIRLAKEHDMDTELMSLALQATPRLMVDAARFFEQKAMYEKAVLLYRKGGALAYALDLCLRANLRDVIESITENLPPSADPTLLVQCAKYFTSTRRFDRAVRLLIQAGRFEQALDLIEQNRVRLTEAMVDQMALKPTKEPAAATRRTEILFRIANTLRAQHEFYQAARKFNEAGDKMKALNTLIEGGDAQQVIAFALNCRSRPIYLQAARFLERQEWRSQPYILKHIILFFTKAYAYDALVAFFEGCAQVEIDEYLEYEKALSALREAYKHLLKSRADDRDEKVANLQTRITLVEKFVKVRKLIKTQPKESIRLCHELLQDENADAALRVGDVYALLVQYFHERGRVQEAYQALEQMRQRGIALDPYLEERYIVDIYAAVGLNAAEVGAIGGEEGEDAGDTGSLDDDGLADGDVADEEEGEALDDILDD